MFNASHSLLYTGKSTGCSAFNRVIGRNSAFVFLDMCGLFAEFFFMLLIVLRLSTTPRAVPRLGL
jgi:hypothetical protein